MVKPKKMGHLHLVYHFTVPLILEAEYGDSLCRGECKHIN